MTDETRHTPGPWEIVFEDLGDEESFVAPVGIRGADKFPVVDFDGGLATGSAAWAEATIEANARLIAAAPEMETLLRDLVEEWDAGLDTDDAFVVLQEAVSRARLTISSIDQEKA